MLRRMSAFVLVPLEPIDLPHVEFAAQMSCVMFVRLVAAVGQRKRVVNVTFNQCQVLPKPILLMKMLTYSFTYTGLVGVMELELAVSPEMYGFELSSCQLQMS